MQKKTKPWRILVARVKCGYRANGPLDEDTLIIFSRGKSFASGFFSPRTAYVSPLGFFNSTRYKFAMGDPWKRKRKSFNQKKRRKRRKARREHRRETNLSVSKRELFYLKTLRWIYCETLLLSRYV